ncbi:hypothetical protein HanXRQr2_Chr13g0594601 [Helianthus annuus]|uniref:Uncharacterized protein n=1 Tax=Helianthus annuus TaxID=4232 RepID=A0A9K3EIX3_HELAN|nr:hypothetical protein HanXRQr2_Chr13g0594601 [Helianthus annuus]KAJ0849759.1 hypothetical protein HanPSC8_Chr13g0572651 [Helianthus annuus]
MFFEAVLNDPVSALRRLDDGKPFTNVVKKERIVEASLLRLSRTTNSGLFFFTSCEELELVSGLPMEASESMCKASRCLLVLPPRIRANPCRLRRLNPSPERTTETKSRSKPQCGCELLRTETGFMYLTTGILVSSSLATMAVSVLLVLLTLTCSVSVSLLCFSSGFESQPIETCQSISR